tara:strand:- start:4010 stop:5167 length:1158 start_codon:yes stop_codon:yes gene_type:complete
MTHSTSVFNIKIDFKNSKGSYIFDKNTCKPYLDFMGMYSSLPLGYNHKVFDSSFKDEINRVSSLKVVNCEILSDEHNDFLHSFKNFTSLDKYSNYSFTCTGALANEAAIKTAMWYKGPQKNGSILSLKNSFHGINSVGNIITTRFKGVDQRQGNLPGEGIWPQAKDLDEAIEIIKRNKNLHGVIIEPIQATFGDNYLPIDKLHKLRKTCTKFDVPLIFDEIQTGFGTTGKTWYFEWLGIEPDIVAFGKKSQVSGIMVKKTHSKVFEMPKKLSVTFDGDLLDMIRCKHIIKAIVEDKLLENATEMSTYFTKQLSSLNAFKHIRSIGLLFCVDLASKSQRDILVKQLFEKGMICNPTGKKSIRMRPNLAVKKEEIDHALDIIKDCFL